MKILKYKGIAPKIHPNAHIFDGVVIAGDVFVDEEVNIWYNSVIRGDLAEVRIGKWTNIQELSLIHCDTGYPTTIGEYVTIGHGAIVHACTVGDCTLIGMGATVLDGAKIGKNCIVGAGALVTKNTVIPDGHLALGNPAKVVRPLRPEEVAFLTESAVRYVEIAKNYYEEGDQTDEKE